jgi:hypothetical protein
VLIAASSGDTHQLNSRVEAEWKLMCLSITTPSAGNAAAKTVTATQAADVLANNIVKPSVQFPTWAKVTVQNS